MRRCHNGRLTDVSNERVAIIIEGEVDKEGRALGIKEVRSFETSLKTSGVPRNFFRGGVQQIQLRTRENGDLGTVAPLVRGSGGSCNLVQEISFHIVKFSQFLVLQTVYDDNQFICHC